jgi:protein O-GlcNAc transferase
MAVEFHVARAFDRADEIYGRLFRSDPNNFRLNHLLGALRQEQGRPHEALEFLEKACRLRPFSAPTFMCRGLALDSLGRHAEAEKSLLAAVAIDGQKFDIWANFGAHYLTVGSTAEAIDAFKRSIALKSDYAHAWTGLGSALHRAGRIEEAVVCHTRALDLEPNQFRARFARAQALQGCHCVEESIADFEAHLQLRPEHYQARSFRLFLLNYRSTFSREALYAEHLAYGRSLEGEIDRLGLARDFTDRTRRPGRLRVGFLSPDLRSHSVAFFLQPILRHLDRSRFELFLYHDHPVHDATTTQLRGLADGWRSLAGQASSVVEAAIREDDPDLLVDLTGHTGFNRMDLVARRLAPVQIAYLGYPNTTGLRAIDFRFTDAVVDPVGDADRLHTEQLVRFAPAAWSYSPPADAPAPGSAARLPGAAVVFGSFNALSKLSPATIRVWRELLAAVHGSQLLLKCIGIVPAWWRRVLADAGIDLSRVQFLPESGSIAEHLALYAQMDVALDPFPYNGTTTTLEALWMGVPVITLAGDRHAARVGASLLTAIGRPEWIAQSEEEYVRRAVQLAGDGALRRQLRTGLREQMRASVLLDHPAQAARFGAALERCWEIAGPAHVSPIMAASVAA